MYKGLKIFKITPVESDMTEMALVENPAIGDLFLKFSEEQEQIQMMFNDDKQILFGVAMKPNYPIFRRGVNGQEDFYVFYDEKGIEDAVRYFFRNGSKFNVEHGDRLIHVDMLESYFAKAGNEFNAPIGSWIIKANVIDKKDWIDVKQSGLAGFSFQGMFAQMEDNAIHNFNKNNKTMNLEQVKNSVLELLDKLSFAEETVVKETVVEEVKEEVKEEFHEEVVAEVVVEEPVEEVKTFSQEEVDATIAAIKAEFTREMEEFKSQISGLNAKLEEFGNQTIPTQTETAEQQNFQAINSPAAKYFSK